MWFVSLIDAVDDLTRAYMRISGRLRPHRMGETFFGARMHCDVRDFIQRRVYFFGVYEPNLTHYVRGRVAAGDRVLDVGANVGYVTLLASGLVGPSGHVTAVEASPSVFRQLTRNLALNACRNVAAVNVAATGAPCLVEIVEGERGNIGSGSVKIARGPAKQVVPGWPILDIVADSAEQVSFIKIDIEGSEGPVLESIVENLGALPGLRTLAVEMAPASAPYVARLREAGFSAYALPNNYRVGATLVRRYLDRSSEGGFVVKIPVEAYSDRFTDYVFEREPAISAGASAGSAGAPVLKVVSRSA